MFHPRTLIDTALRRLGTRPGHDWYLAQLKPNATAVARRNLQRQDFPVFCPLRLETRRYGPRFRTEPRPLFPGYLFIALDPAESRWRAINSTPGVTRLVAFGGMPAAVPQGLVEQIALGCDAEGLILPPDELEPGDRVLVSAGPFAGLLAEVERSEADRRVWILIEVMGQKTRMQVGRDALRRD
ncbi:MAG: transcription termination/antitermination protein NusG [Pararhodobacter sp.]